MLFIFILLRSTRESSSQKSVITGAYKKKSAQYFFYLLFSNKRGIFFSGKAPKLTISWNFNIGKILLKTDHSIECLYIGKNLSIFRIIFNSIKNSSILLSDFYYNNAQPYKSAIDNQIFQLRKPTSPLCKHQPSTSQRSIFTITPTIRNQIYFLKSLAKCKQSRNFLRAPLFLTII